MSDSCLRDAVGRHAVALGQRHRAARDSQQMQDRQVLARLRHDAVVGGDHQQGEVDAAGAHQHGRDEALVAGHVDEAEVRAASAALPPSASA